MTRNAVPVQIPLWTIVTADNPLKMKSINRSDSSMDDCNPTRPGVSGFSTRVQIPLWTIVTFLIVKALKLHKQGSDSSMDDCNEAFDGPKNKGRTRSDSSMDDCNHERNLQGLRGDSVQIPLWTIVTIRSRRTEPGPTLFRFLYGRL